MPGKRIVFHIGGAYHPTAEQAAAVAGWLGSNFVCTAYDGVQAFDALDDADLLVVMGMHWPGMDEEPPGGLRYVPMQSAHRAAFERYVTSGRPLLAHHAAIFSYSDWPRFSDLLGFRWDWETTSYAPVTEYDVQIKPTGHPITQGVTHFTIEDELYVNIQVTPGFEPESHAAVHIRSERTVRGNGHRVTQEVPLVFTAEGGRGPGAGRLVYLANGHDMKAFECPALRQLWINAVRWLLQGR
ncbi:MAG: ThuA domain-containing protein [Anaerolineae bacterium]|nr:ThuA domain-containing protein [Anaerolineae bacterium]